MEWNIVLLTLILISLLISLFGSIVGFGGAVFLVPILITFFHFPFDIAVGTAMVSLVPSSLISTVLNNKVGNVDFRMGIMLEFPTMFGVILGSVMLSFFAAKHLEVLFTVMVFILGLTFFFKHKKESRQNQGLFHRLNKLKPHYILKNRKNHVAYRVSLFIDLIFGMGAGIIAGLFGVGGGFLKTPIMIKVFKIPAKIAAATTLFMILITSITGSISHIIQGHVDFARAWPVILGFAIGAFLGHKFNMRIKSKFVEVLIGIALLLAGAVMMINFFLGH